MRRKKRTRKRRQRKRRRRKRTRRKRTRKRRRRRKRGERIRRRITMEMRVRVKLRGRRRPGAMNQKAARDVRVMREVLVERTKVWFRGIVEEILVRAMRAKVVPARMAVKVPERRATMGVITVSRTQNPEIQLFVTHNDLFIVQATPPALPFLMRIS